MSEDSSFKAVDRQKFKGWLRKWQQARVPLLACLFVEILSPAKALSLAFQGEEIDTVKFISCIETAKNQLERLERKNFEDLPTVNRFLEKVKEADGKYLYQNVDLPSFEEAKAYVSEAKNVLLARIKDAIQSRLEVAENPLVQHAAFVLNTEGWERRSEDGKEDLEFADGCLTELYDHFKLPLSNAGADGSLHDLLEQWHCLLQYTKRYLNPSNTPYLRVWRRIFDSDRRNDWSIVLLLVELLFSIPISNAKVERLFSLMNRVKTDSRATLSENTLNRLTRIRMDGPNLEDYDPTPAIKLWASSATRRPHQKRRKTYRPRKAGKRRKVLIDEIESSPDESGTEYDDDAQSADEGHDVLRYSTFMKLIPELEELE